MWAFTIFSATQQLRSDVTQAVPGFFAQDDPLADADVIGPTGIKQLVQKDILPTQLRFRPVSVFWTPPTRAGLTSGLVLSAKLRELNAQDDAVSYKLFFFGRHGEGYRASPHEESGTQFMTGLNDDWSPSL
ncbi:hypothetical protein B0H13DRAFT_1891143 [Mycena leptocephala]|jgi:hypothetical protein|nr:hypothetical protein B0H13DRAFT_1891143 [Mycena leptocephala]